ncbi:MAG: hypothetical protein HW421_172 [Ignavibacteria bacterium]|nr:hypothetical protein [Ignavibacteria bacterium]
MEVDWYKCKGDVWCELDKIDLEHKYLKGLEGVYIIWSQPEGKRNILKVSFGSIRTELKRDKEDLSLMAFSNYGIFVTWADVSSFKRKGVASYLIDQLKPKFVEKNVQASHIDVNLPW